MIYIFDDYELDADRYELRRADQVLRVEPKVFELLLYFVQQAGQFVSKATLFAQLWPNQFVSEAALAYCVTAARKIVGDTGRTQRIIKTVYGRGYRFIAPVHQRTGPARHSQSATASISQAEALAVDAAPVPEPHATSLLVPGLEEVTLPATPLPMSLAEAERRQVTVIRCHIMADSTLSRPLDAEDLYDIMQAAQHACLEVMQRFQGHVAQRLPDGFLGYFGYPRAREDDAYRAVQAGLALVNTLEQLTVYVGIHTGFVVVATTHSKKTSEPLLRGETPHIAAQIADLARANTVVISPATLRLVEGYFVCQALGMHVLDDLSQPLTLYQVLRQSAAQNRIAVAVTLGLTPLVGREQETGLLRERWEQVKEGLGQVVLLSGEAGIGKSRLIQVHNDYLAAEVCLRMDSRCLPSYQNNALFPVLDYMQRRLQWQPDDPPPLKLRKLEDDLRAHGFPLEEALPLVAPLLSLPLPAHYAPASLPPQLQKQQAFETLLTWLLKEAEQLPTCLILEDLQWADPSTREFLTLLVNQVPTVRMFVLLTCRPEFQPPWVTRAYITHLALNRLTRQQSQCMINSVTRGKSLPAEVLQQLIVKSDGVPLFIEELTKMVLESGLLKEREGQYELVGTLPPLAIPSTLHDSLMARLDRLGTGKQVAQLGATLGREFSYDLLHTIAPMDTPTLHQGLTRLVDADLLYQRGFPPRARYTFKHILVQETAYQSLLRRTRQRYHRQIAQILEAQSPELRQHQPELLAHHYAQAGLLEQAIPYWQQAGQAAMARLAHLEAIAYVQQGLAALAAIADVSERHRHELMLQTMLGGSLAFTRGYGAPEAIHAYARAYQLCELVGDMPQQFAVVRGLWLAYLARSELATANEFGESLLRLAQRQNAPTLLFGAHRAIATSLFFMGQQTAVVPHLERCLAFSSGPSTHAVRPHSGQYTEVMFLLYKAMNLWLRGYPDQSLQTMEQMLQLSQQYADVYSRSHALTLAAILHQWRRETAAVHARIEASLALANEQAFPFVQALSTIFQGWVLAQQSRQDEGIAQMCHGIATYRATGTALASTYMLTLLAEGYRQAGQIEAGLRTLTESLTLAHTHGERWWEAELYRLQGEFLLLQVTPDVARAETALQQALAVARNQQVKSLELRATISLCRLWRQQGQHRQAQDLLRGIYDWFTEGHDTADLTEARALVESFV
jgi:predicted ATPase/DNA-binding winged helix-turn-helix (wHTH) protein